MRIAHVNKRLSNPQLYVERFCANLEYWLGGFYPDGSPQLMTHEAAVERLENEFSNYDSDPKMLEWRILQNQMMY